MKARATKFNKLFDKLMQQLGAVKSNNLGYAYTLQTNEGILDLKCDPVEDSREVIAVFCRFNKPHGKYDSNPYSGKWNHMWSNNKWFVPEDNIRFLKYMLIEKLQATTPGTDEA